MGSTGKRGPQVEQEIARVMNEPIGDGGYAWEGDVINVPITEEASKEPFSNREIDKAISKGSNATKYNIEARLQDLRDMLNSGRVPASRVRDVGNAIRELEEELRRL